jgi:ubiquinone/menaquinone biosynthesis C-methylase UbiE
MSNTEDNEVQSPDPVRLVLVQPHFLSFREKVQKALLHPNRIVPYIRRTLRNRRLRKSSGNFLNYYSRVVDDNAAREGAGSAVGAPREEDWLKFGKLQFNFLISHGLLPNHRVLDIGCGNLRLGAHLVPYLEPQGYVGVDISPRILTAALDTIRSCGLQDKRPYIYLISETNYTFLPENYFDALHAYSVFTHLPIEEIQNVMREGFRVLKPGGWFDFTYFNREKVGNDMQEHFCFPRALMLESAERHGFRATTMNDWVYYQERIRAIKPEQSDSRS